jgi:hypothetical protein
MKKVEILLPDITNLSTRTKFDDQGQVTTIQFNAKIHPGMLARILNLQRQGAPLLATIGSPQASMDLYVQEEQATEPTGSESEVKP